MNLPIGKIIAVITIGASGLREPLLLFSRELRDTVYTTEPTPRVGTSSTSADNYRTVRPYNAEGHVYVTSAHYIWQLLAA